MIPVIIQNTCSGTDTCSWWFPWRRSSVPGRSGWPAGVWWSAAWEEASSAGGRTVRSASPGRRGWTLAASWGLCWKCPCPNKDREICACFRAIFNRCLLIWPDLILLGTSLQIGRSTVQYCLNRGSDFMDRAKWLSGYGATLQQWTNKCCFYLIATSVEEALGVPLFGEYTGKNISLTARWLHLPSIYFYPESGVFQFFLSLPTHMPRSFSVSLLHPVCKKWWWGGWIMWAWVTVGWHAYSTTNSLEPAKALGLMWVSCLPLSLLWESEKKKGIKHVSSFFLLVNLLFVIVSPSVTHNVCIFVPLKASLATSLMPFLVSRLSLQREAKFQSCGQNAEQSQQIIYLKYQS